MANLIGKAMGFKIDNSSASLTDISAYVNSQSLQFAVNILQDTGMGDAKHTTLQGIAQPTQIPLNGWVNTTTDAIFGPVADGTSLTKTAEFKVLASTLLYNGEFWVQDYQISGTPDDLQTWSCTLISQGTVNRTSKALS